MPEQHGAVTFKGDPLTLTGAGSIEVGKPAPDFALTTTDMSKKALSDFKGKVVLLSTVPSLDTSVCDTMTRKFNQEAANLGEDVVVLTVSNDLPPAQKRWCGSADADNIVPLSDYYDHNFQDAYGLRIKELGLIARSVTVIDKEGKVIYHELVKEVAEEPDYDAALKAAKEAAGK